MMMAKQRQLHGPGEQRGEPRADIGGGHRDDAEQRGRFEVDVAREPMSHGSDETRHADDGQAHGDCQLGIVAQHVDEDGHGENRATSAHEAERETDQRGERVAENEHVGVQNMRPVRAIS